LDDAVASARSKSDSPKGLLRIAAPLPFARLMLVPLIPEFFARFPDITVELCLSDKHVDLVSEGIDLAIRASELEDSSLVARSLFDNEMMLVASPSYLDKYGIPATPEDLKQHTCIVYSQLKSNDIWHFTKIGENQVVSVSGNLASNSGEANLHASLEGLGITELPVWMVKTHLCSGELVRVLTEYQADSLPLNAIYPHSRYVPLKITSFIDFLKEKFSGHPLLSAD
jgi:DNA-binding transcriptional LysR family regulator